MSFIISKVLRWKSTESKSDEASEDKDQLYGVILANGQELFGYIPEPIDANNVLHMYKPLLAISYREMNFLESVVLMHPLSMVSNMDSYPINAHHIVTVYPITKDIREQHEKVWSMSMGALSEDELPPKGELIGNGKLSEGTMIIIPPNVGVKN